MSIDDEWDQSGLVGKVAAGRYLISAELNADGRRTLYDAEDVEQSKRVWLGIVQKGTATSDGAKLCSLRHPNLASVLDVGKLDSGQPYLATEIVRGQSLRALLKAGHLEQRRALSIIRDVLEALVVVHEVGAIHGDVKPENVRIAADQHGVERAKLLELGVAMLSGADHVGDPRYRAPDGATAPVDPRADLYSVGAVLYELLTDRPPFFTDDVSTLARMHAHAPVQTLQQRAPEWGYSPELEELAARALAKKADERFGSAAEMIVAIDAAAKSADAVPPAAMTASPPQPARDDSLALLAKELVPVAQPQVVPEIPANASRQVPPLPWWDRALRFGRRLLDRARRFGAALLQRFRKLDRKHKLIAGAVGGALVLGCVIAIVARGGGRARATAGKVEINEQASPIASRAWSLLRTGDAKQAAELIEHELVDHPDDAAAYVVLGHARIALGRPSDGLAAYDHAIRLAPTLATDAELIANVTKTLTKRDPATAMTALEVLSSSTSAAAQDAIVAQASTNPVAEIRHRAFAIAEREGIANRIDRVSSWTLDLQQATTCDERRTIITNLAGTNDRRALPALRQSRAHKCVNRQATAAIQKIGTAAKGH